MSDTIAITGNVATDPELKHTPGGVVIASFRVASAQRRFDRNTNAWVDGGTNWYSVSAFRSLAEHAHASLRRGDRVVLTGRLRVRNWDNGTTRGTAVEIDADAIGHDLLWGTSAFTKGSRPPAGPRDDAWATSGSSTDTWAAPESADPAPATAEVRSESVPEPSLAGAEPPF
jgi:single-strand DNA-binding protein